MNSLFKHGGLLGPVNIAWIGLLAVATGLSWSNALVSIGTGMIIAPALWSRKPSEWGARIRQNPVVLLVLLWVGVYALAGIWSTNHAVWWRDLSIKLPLPFVLLAFTILPAFGPKQVRVALWLLILSAWGIAFATLIQYLGNYAEVNAAIAKSEELHIASGRNHIYFSMVCAVSVIAAIWMRFRDRTRLFRGEDLALLLAGLSLFLMMHVMTARTGLVALYLTLGVLGVWVWLKQGKYLRILLLGLLLAGLPVVAYFTVPSFQNRIENTREDVNRFINDDYINYYSISMRLEANRIAWLVWQDQPWMGTGIAEMKSKMERKYIEVDSSLIPDNRLMPHFQYLEVLLGLGVVGFFSFGLAWFFPLFQLRYRSSLLFAGAWLLFTFAMFSESLLERQIGIALIGMVWGLAYQSMAKPKTDPEA